MKILFLNLFIFTSLSSWANGSIDTLLKQRRVEAISKGLTTNQAINFTCVTGYPTTSVIIETRGDIVKLRIVHHNGVEYAPIHGGLITYNDFPYLEKKGKVIMGLGETIEVEFDKQRCTDHGKGVFDCFNSNNARIGNVETSGFSFQTYKSNVELYGSSFETFHFFFSVTVENFVRDLRMDYTPQTDCLFE